MFGIKIIVERWKFNKDLNVWVSSQGNIRDVNKQNVKYFLDESGYKSVPLDKEKTKGGLEAITVHRAVMMTFKPIDNPSLMTIDHLDNNKRNNSLSNLEWVTASENNRRANSTFRAKNRKTLPTLLDLVASAGLTESQISQLTEEVKHIGGKNKAKLTDGENIENPYISAAKKMKENILANKENWYAKISEDGKTIESNCPHMAAELLLKSSENFNNHWNEAGQDEATRKIFGWVCNPAYPHKWSGVKYEYISDMTFRLLIGKLAKGEY